MARVEVSGLDELRSQLRGLPGLMRSDAKQNIDDAIDHFLDVARSEVEKDEWNLHDSIGVLDRWNDADGQGVILGVDLDHTPATRATKSGTVRDYAMIAHERVRFIDMATESTREFLQQRMSETVSSRLGKLVGKARRFFGSFFR